MAQRFFERKLALAERRARAAPDSSQAQQNLSGSLERVAGLALKRGQKDQALQHYERALRLTQQRAASEPGGADTQRFLLVEHLLLAQAYAECGQGQAARKQVADAQQVLANIRAHRMLEGDADLTDREASLKVLQARVAEMK